MAANDADSAARQEALSSLLHRKLTYETRSGLVDGLQGDEDVGVRVTAVDVMSKYVDKEDTFMQALANHSENDDDPKVRERALAVLNSDSIIR